MKRFVFLSCTVVILLSVALTSCFKKSYDSPPNLGSVGNSIPVNLTLAQLGQIAITAGSTGRVMGDSTVWGIVVADDRSGNFYKQIVIQDSTGGMTVLIDQNNIYADYPIGMKIYIKLKGLYIGTYDGLPELGYAASSTGIAKIPSSLLTNYVVQGSFPNTVVPVHYTLSQLSKNATALLNTLIAIDSIEFKVGYAGQPWAQPVTISASTQLSLEDCSGNSIVLYNSGYANFQPYLTPTGKGVATVIYSVYNSTPQLLMRDTTDFIFRNPRCNGSVVNGNVPVISIDSVRKLYAINGDGFALGSVKIAGTVIETADSLNISAGNIVIEDGSQRGIDLYYGATALNYKVGDSVVIDVSGLTVSRYKPTTGSLEIKTAAVSKTTVVANNVNVTPMVLTVAQINTLYPSGNLEYTLVKILNPTISGGTTYGSKLSIADATGSGLSLYNQYATFSTETVPANPKSIMGVLSSYNSLPEMQLRNPATDVIP